MNEKMGLTKQYLRYVPSGNVNIIVSPRCNVIFVTLQGQEGRFVAVGACEHVIIWDLRLGEKVQVLTGEKIIVTRLAASPNKEHIAVGYADGTVKIFDLKSGENISIFVGHRSEVTSLSYDNLGHRLASGSKDTDIIIWDIVAETGICRLAGHKDVITKIVFMSEHNIIISASKDTLVKFWDLDTEHNFRTLVGHRSEVWSLTLAKNDQYLITGCNDNELHVWKICFVDTQNTEYDINLSTLNIDEDETTDMQKYPLRCGKVGSILRSSKGRIVSLEVDPSKTIIGCHGVDNTIELFHFLQDSKVKEKVTKRLKKERKKANRNKNDVNTNSLNMPTLKDEIKRLPSIKVSNKAKGLDMIMGKGGELRVCIGIDNNSIDLYSLLIEEKDAEVKCLRSIAAHGHRTNVRVVCFSSDNLAFATASGDSVKLWNRPSLACLRTVECGYALTATFVPGDRHLIVGLKDGKMLIIDIASGDILEEVPAHTKELWSVTLFPDLKGIASGGGDQTVKFWNFELIHDPDSKIKAKVLSVLHTRTLKLEECVLCVRISPNNRFVAVSLLDSTVKIFFLDTFKFFVSLYGHKLPVLCMDISSDSTLIATGSTDRNIKIWGLDFGDCHKSIFAHDDSVTGLSFVPGTHYIFTCGKDGKVKQWDADTYQKIVTLQGHSGEAWNCTISPNGVYVVSCGSDKVVRLYEKTAEPLVLEDEAEEERERAENELITGETSAVQGQKQQLLPSRKTVNSEKGAELILECLEVSKAYDEELSKVKNSNILPVLPLLMQAYNSRTSEEFFLETIKRVRASDLEETLLLLPYSAACEILEMLPRLLKSNFHTELLTRLTICLIQAHHGPIMSNQNLLLTLETIKPLIFDKISTLRDIVGYNLHCMLYVQRNLEQKEGVQLFKDATQKKGQRNRIRKNKQKALKRAIMAL
ncbi:WD repeat-containing protein 3 isoform X1 [Vespa velutina]|uniref:WD repeat-containing protein 3 isoform X1 n=1 Tax=Vespa velutina TaxID=202808 RepID=UPI001FB2743C|nr:WD repeat-containing protein 3 isoform X1 [Vespa velutina]